MSDETTTDLNRKPLTVLAEAPLTPPAMEKVPVPEMASAITLTDVDRKLLQGQVTKAIRTVYDPEIPVNIYELGLIYDVDIDAGGRVKVRMTLTAPACPVAGSLPGEVEKRIEAVPGVTSADVELVWEPPWSRDMMSEAARLALDMF